MESVSGCNEPRRRLQVYKLSAGIVQEFHRKNTGAGKYFPVSKQAHIEGFLDQSQIQGYPHTLTAEPRAWPCSRSRIVQLSLAHRSNAMPSTAYMDNDRHGPAADDSATTRKYKAAECKNCRETEAIGIWRDTF